MRDIDYRVFWRVICTELVSVGGIDRVDVGLISLRMGVVFIKAAYSVFSA